MSASSYELGLQSSFTSFSLPFTSIHIGFGLPFLLRGENPIREFLRSTTITAIQPERNIKLYFFPFRSVPSVVRNTNIETPRSNESQLSLSIRQEGSGAMRMLLLAVYSLKHEPKSSFVVYVSIERSNRNVYVGINRSESTFYP